MKKALVVYYSLGGRTRRIGQEIANELGATVDVIEDGRERRGWSGYLQSGFEAAMRGVPAIRARHDPRAFDLIVLGTPIWVGTMASPMRSFLFAHHNQLRDVACFCTMGSRGAKATFEEMAALSGVNNPPTLALTEAQIEANRYRRELETFTSTLKRKLESTQLSSVKASTPEHRPNS